MLDKFSWRGLAQFSGVATFQANPGSLYIRSCLLPDFEGNGIITKFKANFLHQPVGLIFKA